MPEPIGREEHLLRTIRKAVSNAYATNEYTLEINISVGATRINIILMPDPVEDYETRKETLDVHKD